MNLDVGSTIGDYEIVGVLGAGGMGKVFKARNTISDRVEALKILLPDLNGEPELADRFLREIKVLASLQHPNIAALHTALRYENQLLMLMEMVEGVTLDERLHQGPLPVAEAMDYIGQVLTALSYAHRQGVIHRDIKPANMMLTPGGVVKLMDFGIAKTAHDRKLTMTGATLGSLYYMSPEQIRGTGTLDPRSDLYSLGVTLYLLVTGKRPFDGESQFAIMNAHLDKTPVPPIEIDPSLPPALNEVILLSVNKDPAQRFQSADAFRTALLGTRLAAAPAAMAMPAVAAPATVRRPRRALWLAVGALGAVAAIVAAIELAPARKASASKPPEVAQAQVTPPTLAPAPVEAPVQPVQTAPAPAATRASAPPQTVSEPARVAPPPPQPAATSAPVAPPSQAPAAVPAVAKPEQALGPTPEEVARRTELQKLRESKIKLSSRASSLHGTLDNLKARQASSGLGLRRDWVQAAELMDSYLKSSDEALAAGDPGSARDLLDKAEHQIEILEKALQ